MSAENKKTTPHMVVAVKGLLVREGRALIMRRSNGDHTAPGMWEFPGGKLEFGEAIRDALRREISEETGLAATVGQLLYAESVLVSPVRQVIAINHLCTANEGEVELSFEHQAFMWATKAEMESHLDGDILNNLHRNRVFDIVPLLE